MIATVHIRIPWVSGKIEQLEWAVGTAQLMNPLALVSIILGPGHSVAMFTAAHRLSEERGTQLLNVAGQGIPKHRDWTLHPPRLEPNMNEVIIPDTHFLPEHPFMRFE